jgi:hypothetical protein
MTMRLNFKQSLAYLRGEGYPMGQSTLTRMKRDIRKNSLKRLYQVANVEFQEQHLARLDNCELIAKLMWQNYFEERSPYRRVMILKEIKEIQPYLSSYYEATKMVLESRNGARQESSDLSTERSKIPPVR